MATIMNSAANASRMPSSGKTAVKPCPSAMTFKKPSIACACGVTRARMEMNPPTRENGCPPIGTTPPTKASRKLAARPRWNLRLRARTFFACRLLECLPNKPVITPTEADK